MQQRHSRDTRRSTVPLPPPPSTNDANNRRQRGEGDETAAFLQRTVIAADINEQNPVIEKRILTTRTLLPPASANCHARYRLKTLKP